MKKFKDFVLLEKRRNATHPSQQRTFDPVQQLEKYANRDDIYITYTRLKKVGLNPKSDFPDTPIGIYAYPLKEVWRELENGGISNVPFAGDSPYIHVLKDRVGITDISNYSRSDLKNDMKKLRSVYGNDIVDEAEHTISNGEAKYKLYTKNALMSSHLSQRKNAEFGKLWILTFEIARIRNGGSPFYKKHMARWSNVLTRIGHYGFSDKKGLGLIHQAEPIQALFLSTKAFQTIDRVDVKGRNSLHGKMERNPRKIYSKIRRGEMVSDEELIILASSNPTNEIVAKSIKRNHTITPDVLASVIDSLEGSMWFSRIMFMNAYGRGLENHPLVKKAMTDLERRYEEWQANVEYDDWD